MAEDISLDFANTADWHAGPNPEEQLTSYAKAVEWGRRVGALSDAQARVLLTRAEADPGQAGAALRRIVALREAVYRIYSALSHDRSPDPADLQLLNLELNTASAHLRLVPVPGEGRRFDWAWTGMDSDLASLLWPVARAASLLLTSPRLERVRECAGEACGWVFMDLSRNGSRRWCDMADCGNRAKARRYRERQRAESKEAAEADGSAEGPPA